MTGEFERMVGRLMAESWVDYNPRDWPWWRMQAAGREADRRRQERPREIPVLKMSMFHVKPDAVASGRERLGE